jgi:hypothetical protein
VEIVPREAEDGERLVRVAAVLTVHLLPQVGNARVRGARILLVLGRPEHLADQRADDLATERNEGAHRRAAERLAEDPGQRARDGSLTFLAHQASAPKIDPPMLAA